MSDEQTQPVIRDPKGPANMLGDAPSGTDARNLSSALTNAQSPAAPVAASPTPVASLASVASPAPSVLPQSSSNDPLGITAVADVEDFSTDRALAAVDPLTRRPRISSRVLAVLLGLLMLAAAAGVWLLAVATEGGQAFDDMVWSYAGDRLPAWVKLNFASEFGLNSSHLIIAVSAIFALGTLIVVLVRRRWWLLGQLVVFGALCGAAELLKGVLPRPFIIQTAAPAANSAPSGHTLLAFAAALALVLAVSRAWRAWAALLAGAWSGLVGVSVVAGQWHRPSDVAMAMLIVGGVAMLAMAFTRASGMDAPGKRATSASVQIVSSVLITAGLMALAYGGYIIWQVVPGLSMSAAWARSGAVTSSIIVIGGLTALLVGLSLAFRQLTASPLSRLGLIGAPPAPPASSSRTAARMGRRSSL